MKCPTCAKSWMLGVPTLKCRMPGKDMSTARYDALHAEYVRDVICRAMRDMMPLPGCMQDRECCVPAPSSAGALLVVALL